MRKEIEIGTEFTKWTVVRDNGTNSNGKKVYWCRCDCGFECEVIGSHLRNNRSTRCVKCAKVGENRTGSKTKISQDLIDEVVKLYVEGGSSVELGRRFNINPVTVLNYVKRSGHKTRDICEHGERCRKAPGEAAKNATYKRYKAQAKYRSLNFNLSKNEFFCIAERSCDYCGSAPSNTTKASSGNWSYNGLDRVDSSKGYEIDNVVPCCIRCNIAKSDMSRKDFCEWIGTVWDHLNQHGG